MAEVNKKDKKISLERQDYMNLHEKKEGNGRPCKPWPHQWMTLIFKHLNKLNAK